MNNQNQVKEELKKKIHQKYEDYVKTFDRKGYYCYNPFVSKYIYKTKRKYETNPEFFHDRRIIFADDWNTIDSIRNMWTQTHNTLD